MKKLRFLVATFALFVLGVSTVSAQKFALDVQGTFGINVGSAWSTGISGASQNIGFGGLIAGRYMTNEKFGVGLNLGYYVAPVTGLPSGLSSSASLIPITAAVDYKFKDEGFTPYVGAELGYVAVTSSVTSSGITVSANGGGFGLAPTFGILLPLSDAIDLNVNVKYYYASVSQTSGGVSSTSNVTWIPINVGVRFKLGS
jgi:outer membrane protein W